MRISPLLTAGALAALLLAGCATTTTTTVPSAGTPATNSTLPAASPATDPKPTTPAQPVTPVQVAELPATIRGSQESSTLLDNFTAFVTAVDGQKVEAGRPGWEQALPLAPGKRRLTVEFNRGVFFARTELTLDAKPGVAYELRQTNDAQVYGDHTFCEFWIVDLVTGENAVPARRTGLGNVKTGG